MSEFNWEDRYIVLKRSDLQQLGEEKQAIADQHLDAVTALFDGVKNLRERCFLVLEEDWPEFETAAKAIEARVTGDGSAAKEDLGKVAVAALAVQLISKLHLALDQSNADYENSSLFTEVQCATAFFTSVIDGKCESPEFIEGGFANACEAVDQSILDEMTRCQVMLQEQVERAARAESETLIHKQYAGWYLWLRDCDSGDLRVVEGPTYDCVSVSGLDLDAAMEDLDGETEDGIDIPAQQEGPKCRTCKDTGCPDCY